MAPNVRAQEPVDDASMDRYARMVQRYLEVPVALVTVVHADHQEFLGEVGLEEPYAETRRTPLSHSFCQHVVADEAPLVIDDARTDERLRDNLAIADLGVIGYAGWPLIDEEGATIGALCAIDHEPRNWTHEDLEALADIADACSAELMYRRRQRSAEHEAAAANAISQRSQVLLALSEGLAMTTTLDDVAYAVEQVARETLGCLHAGIWLRLPSETGDDRLTYVSDPSARWSSAARNSALAIDESNPLGESVVTDGPLYFASKAEQNDRYPHLDLSAQVGDARAFVPLTLSRTLGTLALVWDSEREIHAEERVTLVALASYVAQAVQRALLLREREHTALTLQNALLPRLPEADRMEFAALYRPAKARDRVGGDWYDAVVTRTGETYLMIGDVMGHDMAAAAVMGELRSILRTLTWTHDDAPALTVARLDEAMAAFGTERFASLVYVHVSAADGSGGRTLTWTNAGHLSPVMVCANGGAVLVDAGDDRDLLLGIDPSLPRRDHVLDAPAGSTLILFTDGLVERRDEPIDVGKERLRALAADHADETPERLVHLLVDVLVGDTHDDDVAVLAVRFA